LSGQSSAQKPICYSASGGLLLATLLLYGCDSGGAFYGLSKQRNISKTEIVNVTNGHFNVTPPPGFCKDESGSKNTETAAFLMFANCGYLNSGGRRASRSASFSGLVTTSIAKTPAFQGGNGINDLSEFLSSGSGRKSLSASDNADTVAIVDRRQASDGVFLQLHDSDAALSQNVWKSFLNRSDHLVTVTLLQNKDAPQTPEQSMQFLQSYSETIKLSTGKLNTDTITVATTDKPANKSQPMTTRTINGLKTGLKNVGFLRWLFL